jgi:Flp pilus assembly protein TadD
MIGLSSFLGCGEEKETIYNMLTRFYQTSNLPVLVLLMLGFFFFNDTATTENRPGFVTSDEHYEPVLDRQKAGIESQGEILETLPEKSAEEYEKLGDAHVQNKQMGQAVIQYQKALEMDPSRVSLRYKVGILLLNNGNPQMAKTLFEEILQYDVMYALAYEGLGQAMLQLGDDVGADQQFRRALGFDPTLWKSHNYLGILADRRHLHLSAIEAYKAALAIQPNEPSVLNNLGMAYYMNGKYKEAIRVFHLALQSGGDQPKIANNLGLSLAKLGRFSEAFDAFRKGTNSAMAYNNVGIALLEAGTPNRAASCFEKAIKLHPAYYEKANENLTYAQRVGHAEKPSRSTQSEQSVACF